MRSMHTENIFSFNEKCCLTAMFVGLGVYALGFVASGVYMLMNFSLPLALLVGALMVGGWVFVRAVAQCQWRLSCRAVNRWVGTTNPTRGQIVEQMRKARHQYNLTLRCALKSHLRGIL